MLTYSWEPGKSIGVLDIIKSVSLSRKAANAAGRSYTDEVEAYMESGQAFQRHKGSVNIHPRWKFEGDGAMVYIRSRAPKGQVQTIPEMLEHGTGSHGPSGRPYEIRPRENRRQQYLRSVLRLRGLETAGGPMVFARYVKDHPGARATPYFFTDIEAREQRMIKSAMDAIEQKIEGAR